MSLDLLTIGLGFQTDGLEKGTSALKNNEQAANKAADAADNASSKMRIMSDAQKAAASATEKVRESIDKQVSAMRQQVETFGMSERQSKLYKLSIDGATESQLKQAEAALKQVDALKRAGEMGESAGRAIKVGALAAVAGIGATIAAFEMLIGKVSQYQDLAEQTGGDPAGIASLRTAADVGGASIEQLIASANRMQRSLASVDDESKGVGRALGAIGIEVESFKKLRADEQFKAVAKAMSGYEDGLGKVAVMNDIFGRGSAALIPAMKELAAQTDTNNGLTTEQIQLADEYKDAQARAKSELMQMAEQMAVAALPAVTELTGAVKETIQELFNLDARGNKLAASNDVQNFAQASAIALAHIADLGYAVAKSFEFVGDNNGSTAARIAAIARLDFDGVDAIDKASIEFNNNLKISLGLADKLEAKFSSIAKNKNFGIKDGDSGSWDDAKSGKNLDDYRSKAAKAVKAVADEYAKLSAEIAKQLALSQAELDGNGKLEASEKYRITTLEKLIEQYQAGKITLKEYIDLESKMNDVQGVMEKAEAQAKAAKAAQAAYAESLQYQDDVNKALREEADARNRIRLAVGANTVAAEEAQQLAQLEMQTVFASAEDRKRILDYYRIELDLRKKIAAINSAGGIDQAERDRLIAIEAENAARLKGVADMGAAMQSTTSIWQSIDQTAHTVWTNVLQGGQDVWSKLKNTAKSVFFDWLYQMTLKKWIFSIGATVSGTGAMAQTAGASGGVSSALSLGSSAANFLGLNSATGLGSLFGSSASYGAAIGTSSIGAGSQAAMLAAQTGEFGAAGALATSSAAAGSGAGIMATLGPAMPYIAAAAGVYMLAKGMGGGESRSGATYTSDAKGQAVYNQGPSGGEISADQSRGLFGSTQTEINRLLAGFGSKATVSGFTAGLESSKNGKGFQFSGGYIGDKAFGENLGRTGGQFSMQSQDDATALANYSTDLQRSVLEALQAADLGGSVGAWLSGLGDIEKLSKDQVSTNLTQVTAYQQLQEASKSYPAALDNIKTMTVEASAKLLEVAGGLDGLQTALASYFDLFGTDAEKYNQAIKTVHAGFDAINVVMPASNANLREWYKSEVARLGAMDLGVEANAKAYAGALKLASGVDALAKAEEQAAATKQSWQDQLNVLTGKTTDTALQMQRDLASTTDESTQALIRQVYAEKDRQKAMAESATAMQKMATDQAAAAQKSADAYKSALSAQQSYYASLTSAGDAVRNLLAGLKTGVNAGTSPQSRLDAARAQYLQDLSAARGGDFAAYNRVATTAQTYIGAGDAMYASSAEQKAIIAQVQSELQNLPAVSQYDANLAQLKAIEAAIKSNTTSTNSAIGTLNTETLAAIASMTGTLSNNFASIDINNNGVLTFDELKAGLNISEELTRQLIASVDLNGDGQISQLEVIKANTANTTASLDAQKIDTLAAIASMTATLSNNFATIDINGSGLITFAEMKEALGTGDTLTQQLINAIDANGDGQISKLELIASNTGGLADLSKINKAINQFDWSDAGKSASVSGFSAIAKQNNWSVAQIAAASGYNTAEISKLFAGTGIGTGVGGSEQKAILAAIASMTATLSNNFSTIDINGSGLITFAEMKDALGTGDNLTRQLINAIDANGDGQISQLEVIKANTANTTASLDAQKIDTLAAIASMTGTLSNSFSTIDINGSGLITFAEMKDALGTGDTLTQQLINAIDTNGDGQISKLEIIAANTGKIDPLTSAILSSFDTLDANTSGALTFEELKAGLGIGDDLTRSLIASVDANGDGQISNLELIAANTNGIQPLTTAIVSSFASLDANASGALTFEELKTGLGVGDSLIRNLIAAVDTNGDGQISKLELIASNTGGLAELDKINKTINQFDWADSNKPAAIAGFSNIAKQNNWSVAQIAAASGYSTAEISKLFAGTGIGTGVGGTGTTSTTSTASTATAAPNYAVIAGIVNSLNWDTASKASSATALYGLSLASGWTQQMIASATGYSYPSIQSLFASVGIPNFETGGTHMGGLRLVGERGPELEVTGPSRIWNASDTANMLRGGRDDQALVEEVRELRKEVAKSKGEDAPIHLHIMGTDGKTLSEIVIRDVKERSRRGEKLIFQAGIVQ